MRALVASIIVVAVAVTVTAAEAWAQDQLAAPEKYPFEGGTLTITPTIDLDKVLDFDGKELARNYDLSLDRMIEVNGMKVALFAVGDGGNMCPPSTVIVWKPEGADIKSETVGGDCGGPSPAATTAGIYFVPYLLPGASGDVRQWTPGKGVQLVGRLSYAPESGTTWDDLDPTKFDNVTDALRNEAVYEAAKKLLGEKLTDVTTGLLVGGGTQSTASGAFYAAGCVPHDCGGADGFMAVDPKGHKVYFAQRADEGKIAAWPSLKKWPADLRDAMKQAIAGG
jgi:hypothetical protein